MKMYLYCSHKYSPVGFQLGTINKSDANSDLLSLIKDNSESLIEKIFVCSGLLSAFGKTSENKWCCLLKKIDDYKNIAIETDSFEEFKIVKENLTKISKTELIKLIDSFIDTEAVDSKFGYKIKKVEFEKFKELLLKPCSINEESEAKECLILTLSFKKDISELAQNLNLNREEFSKGNSDLEIIYGKKKLKKMLPKNLEENSKTSATAMKGKVSIQKQKSSKFMVFLFIIMLVILSMSCYKVFDLSKQKSELNTQISKLNSQISKLNDKNAKLLKDNKDLSSLTVYKENYEKLENWIKSCPLNLGDIQNSASQNQDLNTNQAMKNDIQNEVKPEQKQSSKEEEKATESTKNPNYEISETDEYNLKIVKMVLNGDSEKAKELYDKPDGKSQKIKDAISELKLSDEDRRKIGKALRDNEMYF